MKLLVTDCTKEIPIALDGVHEGNGSEVNYTTVEDEEEIVNPLQNYRQQESESLLVNNNIHEIAPVEVFLTKKILFDKNCKELAFPQFFSKGRFGYSPEREIKLFPSKYFNQRLLNYKQSFASNSDYIFVHNQFYKKRILETRFQFL